MILRYLNIEVALGVVALSLIAQRLLHCTLPPLFYVVVPLTTWSMYTFDRILDVRSTSSDDLSERHTFARRHQRILGVAALVGIVGAGAIAVVAFPSSYWCAALPLAVLTALHPLWQRTAGSVSAIVKDVNVAVVFTASAFVIPWIESTHHVTWLSVAVWAILATIVMIDIVWLSILDRPRDERLHDPSIAVVLGEQRSKVVIRVMSALSIAATCLLMVAGLEVSIGLVLLGMSFAYLLFPFDRLKNSHTARLAVEAMLLMPLSLLLV